MPNLPLPMPLSSPTAARGIAPFRRSFTGQDSCGLSEKSSPVDLSCRRSRDFLRERP
jgi:hypothetical protein